MGQKGHPEGFRLAFRKNWKSSWFASEKSTYSAYLLEDFKIRKLIKEKLRAAFISKVNIERAGNRIRLTIFSARPGAIIGRKGQELDKLKAEIQKIVSGEIILDIKEIKKPELNAQVISENIALQLERRVSFRRAMKRSVEQARALGAAGIRIRCAGRLNGADIARAELIHDGKVPLHTIREDISYGFAEARTIYGIIGVQVWMCANLQDDK